MIIYKIGYTELAESDFRIKFGEKIMDRIPPEETLKKFKEFALSLIKTAGINTDSLKIEKIIITHLVGIFTLCPPNDDYRQNIMNEIMENECHECQRKLETITEKYWWFGKRILITLQCPSGMHLLYRIKIKL